MTDPVRDFSALLGPARAFPKLSGKHTPPSRKIPTKQKCTIPRVNLPESAGKRKEVSRIPSISTKSPTTPSTTRASNASRSHLYHLLFLPVPPRHGRAFNFEGLARRSPRLAKTIISRQQGRAEKSQTVSRKKLTASRDKNHGDERGE